MDKPLVKMVKLNGLQYNPNRDPQVYRRVAGKPFQIQLHLNGSGKGQVSIEAEGKSQCSGDIELPGVFNCEASFKAAGSRLANVTIKAEGKEERFDLRLDVDAHAKIG